MLYFAFGLHIIRTLFIITNNATLTNSVPISFSICIIISVEWSYRSEMAES